jgi:hypothetical protein
MDLDDQSLSEMPDFDAQSDGCDTPDFRATVQRSGAIRLVDWGDWLASCGPLYTLLAARGRAGVAIADLTVVRDDECNARELIVDFLCGGTSAQRFALTRWASFVGYRRIWIEGGVHELDPSPGGAASTRCSGCGERLIEAKAGFWGYVRRRGAFPATCVLCGSDLPQWTRVGQTEEQQPDPAKAPMSGRSARE